MMATGASFIGNGGHIIGAENCWPQQQEPSGRQVALGQMRAVDFLHTGALTEEILFPGASCSVMLGF